MFSRGRRQLEYFREDETKECHVISLSIFIVLLLLSIILNSITELGL